MTFKIKKLKLKVKQAERTIKHLIAKADPDYREILEMKGSATQLFAKWILKDGSLKTQTWIIKSTMPKSMRKNGIITIN